MVAAGRLVRRGQSVASNTVKETHEEAGLLVKPEKVIAVHDWRKHNRYNLPYGVIKIFVQCSVTGGSFQENIETTETAYFAKDALPSRPRKKSDGGTDRDVLCGI